MGLPGEAKISEAYQMLKKQGEAAFAPRVWPCGGSERGDVLRKRPCFSSSGIVKQDPVLSDDKVLLLPPPRPKNAIFEDEEKSKVSFWKGEGAILFFMFFKK